MDNPFAYSVWAKLYKIQLIGKTRFREEYHINEDSLFIFELLCKQPIFVGINKELYFYRTTANSLSRQKFSEKYFDILSIANIKYEKVQKQFPELLNLAENMKLKAAMNLLQILALRTKKEYRSKEKELLKYVMQNKSFYISATKENDKWLFILTHHLFYVYKMILLLRG